MATPGVVSPRNKLSRAERRECVALASRSGKSRRLIAQELNAGEATVRRDLAYLRIADGQKPSVTRRKKVIPWKTSRQRAAAEKVLKEQQYWEEFRRKTALSAWGRGHKVVLPPKPQPRQPKPLISEQTRQQRPRQTRKQRVNEMADLIQAWLRDWWINYFPATPVLDKARNRLRAKPSPFMDQLSDSPLSAAELMIETKPPEMDSGPLNTYRREEVCSLWLARWLAAWAPRDETLRDDVFKEIRRRLKID